MCKEEKKAKQQQIDELIKLAGLDKVFGEMVTCGGKKVVTDSKLTSALSDLSELYKEIEKRAVKEAEHWLNILQKKGWSQDDEYKKINEIKKNVSNWIKSEAEATASVLENAMTKDIVTYILKVNGKVSNGEIQRIVVDSWEKELLPKKDVWVKRFAKEYSQEFVNFSGNTRPITPPDMASITEGLTNIIMGILESLRYAGPQSIAMGSVGAAITVAGGAAVSVPLIGPALVTVAAIAGPALIIVAAVPLLPAIFDKIKQHKEQYKKEVEAKLHDWMKKLDMAPVITALLNEQNDALYELCKSQFALDVREDVDKFERCVELKNKILEAKETIAQQFPGKFKG
ncbi:hypothetical protein ACYULU_15260 [Breznakiellaceae bacterium SP9]